MKYRKKEAQNIIEYILIVASVIIAALTIVQSGHFKSTVNTVLDNPVQLLDEGTRDVRLHNVSIPTTSPQ